LRRERVPHALLFPGIDAYGKQTAALTLAMALNCQGRPLPAAPDAGPDAGFADVDPCGECVSCRKIQSGHHPDILTVAPTGPIIRISQIRALYDTLSMKPYEALRRVVVIAAAETMNSEASNALLKLLEEPPAQTVFILLAPQASDLLPTIGSRCQQVHFHPVSQGELKRQLMEKEDLPPEEADVIAALAGGSYNRALSLSRPVKGLDWKQWRGWLLRASGLERPRELSQRPVGSLLVFAEQLASGREILPDALDLLEAWLRDLVVFKFCPEKIINRDLAGTIGSVSPAETVSVLLAKIEALQAARKAIRTNANARLAIEAMMLKMAY